MCAACVAQGITYVGGALGSLQVMAARAKARRRGGADADADVDDPDVTESPTREPAEPVAVH